MALHTTLYASCTRRNVHRLSADLRRLRLNNEISCLFPLSKSVYGNLNGVNTITVLQHAREEAHNSVRLYSIWKQINTNLCLLQQQNVAWHVLLCTFKACLHEITRITLDFSNISISLGTQSLSFLWSACCVRCVTPVDCSNVSSGRSYEINVETLKRD